MGMRQRVSAVRAALTKALVLLAEMLETVCVIAILAVTWRTTSKSSPAVLLSLSS